MRLRRPRVPRRAGRGRSSSGSICTGAGSSRNSPDDSPPPARRRRASTMGVTISCPSAASAAAFDASAACRAGLVGDEDGGAVAVAAVAELAARHRSDRRCARRCRRAGDSSTLVRIVGHLDGFIVPGAAVADLLVGRILERAAGIAGDGLEHARHRVEIGLDAPEAAAGEDGRLRLGGHRPATSPWRARPAIPAAINNVHASSFLQCFRRMWGPPARSASLGHASVTRCEEGDAGDRAHAAEMERAA